MSRLVTLGEVLRHRKGSIIIDDAVEYKRCRVQLHRRGVEVRDIVPGTVIRTKKQQLCKAGDFIVAEMDAKFGGYGFLNESLEGAIVSSHYYLFEVITEKMLPEYLAVINKTDILQNQIKAKGSTNYSAVRPVDVLGWTIPLPSLTEQQRIIDEVEVTEKEQQLLLPEFDKQLANLTQLRQALLREAMQGQLLPQDPTDEPATMLLQQLQAAAKPGKKGRGKAGALFAEELEGPHSLPNGWTWCSLSDLASVITKGSSPTWQGVKYVDKSSDGILFITSKNVGSYKLILEKLDYVEQKFNEIEPRSILKKGDLLTNIVGASIGRTAIYDLDELANINQAVCLIRIGSELINKQYLLHYFNSDFALALIAESQFAPGRANLSMSNIAQFPVPLPPLAEQHRIVAKLEQLMQHCDALEQRIRESRRLAEQLLATALREALAPPAGTEPTEEAELELVEAETTSAAPRQGRPRKPVLRSGDQMSLDGLFD